MTKKKKIIIIVIIVFSLLIIGGTALYFSLKKNDKPYNSERDDKPNNSEQIQKKKVIICFFGVVSRSIKYTYKSLKQNIIDVLKKDYDCDIYVFNNYIDNAKVDNVSVDNTDVHLLNADFFEQIKQSIIDREIKEYIKSKDITLKFLKQYHKQNQVDNALRQMYSEEKVGDFLEKHINDYDCAVICGPDYYLLNKINVQHIADSINNKSTVYATNVNDAHGYTNGLYFGSLNPLIKILKRYSLLEILLPTNKDYEYLLKKVFDHYEIDRSVTDTKFIKIRSNKKVARQGEMRSTRYDKIINKISKNL